LESTITAIGGLAGGLERFAEETQYWVGNSLRRTSWWAIGQLG
jgi:hypothetical protein